MTIERREYLGRRIVAYLHTPYPLSSLRENYIQALSLRLNYERGTGSHCGKYSLLTIWPQNMRKKVRASLYIGSITLLERVKGATLDLFEV